jgi:hypothetical protein
VEVRSARRRGAADSDAAPAGRRNCGRGSEADTPAGRATTPRDARTRSGARPHVCVLLSNIMAAERDAE